MLAKMKEGFCLPTRAGKEHPQCHLLGITGLPELSPGSLVRQTVDIGKQKNAHSRPGKASTGLFLILRFDPGSVGSASLWDSLLAKILGPYHGHGSMALLAPPGVTRHLLRDTARNMAECQR